MVFSSLPFLFLFLPLCIGVYFLLPRRCCNTVLLLFSLLFYGAGGWQHVPLMLLTVLANYLFGLRISRLQGKPRQAKRWLIGAVLFNLMLLFLFKYLDLCIRLLSYIPALSHWTPLGLSLPVGISFYTFQALSYVIDVYRREVCAQKNPITFGAYVTLFPQLVAGPIVRYQEVEEQLSHRTHSIPLVAEGIRCFLIGLAKKLLLANPAGDMWQLLRQAVPHQSNLCGAWLGLLFFAFQIYYDFSGYSDMAIGLGKLFGFRFPENFRYPYTALSVTDFWRRWHITLSTWFREYVYIPLGGNRRGRWRTYGNLLAVWLFTGLWHGASLNFLLWGLYFFLLLSVEKSFPGKFLMRIPKLLRRGVTFLLILLGWLLFVCDGSESGLSFSDGISYAHALFGMGDVPLFDANVRYHLLRSLPFLLLMAVGATPLPKRVWERIADRFPTTTIWVSNLLCLPLFLLCLSYLVNSGYNPFLYFRF